ncbi:MAG: methyltransferase domain-containing protein [Candidatus Kerfeldbacteria bacterium]|nr:methyltransferase domain-containing protein [Candidatus Kerfeldbacteria bacterium]
MNVQSKGQIWKAIQKFKLFAMNTSAAEWEELYRTLAISDLPWESGKPSPTLVRLVESGSIRGRVLDVGCGSGTQAVWMAERGLEVTGVDISKTAIVRARELAAAHAIAVDFRVADARRLPFTDAMFDSVFDRGVFHHQERRKASYAKEIARVLKGGGTYLLLTFSPRMRWPKSVSENEIKKNFGEIFNLESVGEETHVQPDARKVTLASYLLKKYD